MDYVDEWKEKELVRTIEDFNEFMIQYEDYLEENSRIVELHNNKNYYAKTQGLDIEQINKDYKEHYEKFNKFKKTNSYYYDLQYKAMYRYYKSRGEEDKTLKDIETRIRKDIDKHFNTLQTKVENKIGTIIKIQHLGGDDYRFEGTEGNCKVEVILAGGYNIQRLHTRWIIKK